MSDVRNKRAGWSGTAFIVEAIVLLAVLVACMAVFTQLFAHALVAAQDGERLSCAVTAAQNAAEEFSADPAAAYVGKPVGQGAAMGGDAACSVSCEVAKAQQGAGTRYRAHITAYDEQGAIYELDVERYVGEKEG